LVAKNDYAINGGSLRPSGSDISGPARLADAPKYTDWKLTGRNGISHHRSQVGSAQVTDGTNVTYLAGEKYVPIRAYLGKPSADNNTGDNYIAYSGDEEQISRWGASNFSASSTTISDNPPWIPQKDGKSTIAAGSAAEESTFGGPHTTCQFVFCDGSVHSIDFFIDPLVHARLSCRNDGQVVDSTIFQ
jgi:hypothetical protein